MLVMLLGEIHLRFCTAIAPTELKKALKKKKIDRFLFLFSYRYVIVAPRLLRVGASEKIVIQAFGYEQEFPATISIKSFPDKQTTYASGRIQLSPSNKFQGSVTLTVRSEALQHRCA